MANVFDEIKNQWGWAGFVTHDLRRCRIMARLIALVYNWWNIFTRLAQPDRHLEAVTSRPLLLHAVGRLVTTGRRKIVRLTSTHAMADKVQMVLSRIGAFFNRLKAIAEQLSPEAIWAVILSVAFRVWLRGKGIHPVVEGNQTLLLLTARVGKGQIKNSSLARSARELLFLGSVSLIKVARNDVV